MTARSDNNVATVCEVVLVPLSASTKFGMQRTPKLSFIISTARTPDSFCMHVCNNDEPRVNIDQQIAIKVLTLHRTRQLGDVPDIPLPRSRDHQFQDKLGAYALPSTLRTGAILSAHTHYRMLLLYNKHAPASCRRGSVFMPPVSTTVTLIRRSTPKRSSDPAQCLPRSGTHSGYVRACPAQKKSFDQIMSVFHYVLRRALAVGLIKDRLNVRVHLAHGRSLMCFAGTPPTIVLAGTSLLTTEPAAIMQDSPIVTPPRMIEPAPTQVPSPTTIGGNEPLPAHRAAPPTS